MVSKVVCVLSCATIALAALASGCGGGGLSEKERRTAASRLATGVRIEYEKQSASAAEKAWKTCLKQLARLSSAVESVDEAVQRDTVDFDEYTSGVARVARELDRLDVAGLSDACLAVAGALEDAGRIYDTADDLWSLCDARYYEGPCQTETLYPMLQRAWPLGLNQSRKADRLLDKMRTKPPPGTPTYRGVDLDVPENAGDVQRSVYGQAVVIYCGPSMSVASSEACASLRDVLSGGIDPDERDDLDTAAQELIEAHNLEPDSEA